MDLKTHQIFMKMVGDLVKIHSMVVVDHYLMVVIIRLEI